MSQQILQRTVLNNGIVVLVTENPAADIIATRMFIKSGSYCEPLPKAGLAHLLAAVLTKGTQNLSSLEIAEQVESLGASLGIDASADYFLVSLKTVTSDFPAILTLAAELMRSPAFPEFEIEMERRWLQQSIRSQQEQPFSIAFDQLRQLMYPNHPYASSGLGTEATIPTITRADLIAYHNIYFRPDNLVISIAGRISAADAVAMVENVFGDWQCPTTRLPVIELPQLLSQPQEARASRPTQQSILMLGYLAAAVGEADYIALKLLSTYLGNGLSSRLFVELREKRGLAYEVSAFYPTRQDPAPFVVYMGTAPENTTVALEGLRTEVELLCNTQLEPEALQAAKNKLLGQYALGKQTNAQIAQIFGWYETMGLGVEFDSQFQAQISAVSAAQLQQVACKYLREPYISVVGPEIINNAIVPATI